MIPAGYMAKRVRRRPDWIKAAQVADIYSLSRCVSAGFADYIEHWKHNDYWLLDSPKIIQGVVSEYSIQLVGGRRCSNFTIQPGSLAASAWSLCGGETAVSGQWLTLSRAVTAARDLGHGFPRFLRL